MAITKRTNKKGVAWSVDIYVDGKRYRRTVGTKRQAELVEARLKAKVSQAKWGIQQAEEITFRELVKRYLDYTAVNKAASTHRNDQYRIEANLLPFFGDHGFGWRTKCVVLLAVRACVCLGAWRVYLVRVPLHFTRTPVQKDCCPACARGRYVCDSGGRIPR